MDLRKLINKSLEQSLLFKHKFLLAVYLELKRINYLKKTNMKKLLICAVITMGFIGCNSGTDTSTTSSDSTTMTTDGSNAAVGTDTTTNAAGGNTNNLGGSTSGSTPGGSMDTSMSGSGSNSGPGNSGSDTARSSR